METARGSKEASARETRDELTNELTQARVELKEQILENNKLQEEMELAGERHKQAVMEATEKQYLLQCQANITVQQLKSVREETLKMKRDLETTQENYERKLQIHAAEISKLMVCRREMEKLRTSLRDREAEVKTLNMKPSQWKRRRKLNWNCFRSA
ncbi:hypothetical protein PsorP6_012956 [Peronosclerospora sorghi]|uniref:Uncharacterized protein n=1 Tax=Peronosclerospora sorghi TaxID=230839 RepID=A0ACC0WGW3_9STRA|nr:hypothetical protein PsorP6_012956 [Peronosclerospora sorghi]